jgi:PPOX class probable F420-dependent enzyme
MNTIGTQAMRHRIEGAMVARLATVAPDGRPHIVPITYAATEDALYFAVDQKPKRSATLQRLRNIDANPAVSVLIDHYEDDWTRLWWVRVDGRARIVRDGAELEAAINLLSRRYPQYRSTRPVGPAVVIEIERMTGWSAS